MNVSKINDDDYDIYVLTYLTNRTQTVRIGSVTSEPSICLSGLPQGSVLGPILFSLYISLIGQIVSDFSISHQQYADDVQLYINLKSTTIGTSISRLKTCLSTLHSWLCFNGLSLNPDKSEAILFGTHQRLQTFPATPSIHISGTVVEPSDQITSLVVVMDSNLTFNAHITVLCKACHLHLRSHRHIKRSLTDDMAILIDVALVQSRLDYCNSLFFNRSCFNINKLQRVQNLAAKHALNDWCSPTQQIFVKLHWLPIQSRIKFKICTLTQITHNMFLLVCWGHLINAYWLNRELERALANWCAFSVCAPNVWNSLPLSIRLSPTLATFKHNLKTFYFASSQVSSDFLGLRLGYRFVYLGCL